MAKIPDPTELLVQLACGETLEDPNWEVAKVPHQNVNHLYSSTLRVGHCDAVPQRKNVPDQRTVVPTLEVAAVRISEILCSFH